jgi:cyclopropane-fatty-acyl-phospholipid synthase
VTLEDVAVRPERLLSRARPTRLPFLTTRPRPRAIALARGATQRLLRRMTHDRLIVREALTESTYGSARPDLVGEITIHDGRAYVAVITEGSIGLGRGFIEGWWDSPDPVTAVRVIIRNLAAVDELRNRVHTYTGWATDRLRRVLPRPGRHRNREDISAHYDLGNRFFELFLDETMTYSAAVFPTVDTPLAAASLHKYDMLLDKLGVDASHRLLEIGTGWGGLALRAVETAGCQVTTTTISAEQFDEATQRIKQAGYEDRITLLDVDWRDLAGQHDRVISIEMIEAVDWRDYEAFFGTIERCLRPDGLVAIQAICLPDGRYARAKNTEDFIRRFVFPNGCLSSIGAISRSVARATRMQVVDVEDISVHYAETLRQWRDRFETHLDEVNELGLDNRFCRLWRFYLAYCEAGFRERHCTVNQIVLAGRDWRGTIARSDAPTR